MEHPLSPGGVVECWSGTSHALTPWVPYAALAKREAGAVVAEMEQNKREKYIHLDPNHFCPNSSRDTGCDGDRGRSLLQGPRQADCSRHFRATVSSVPMWQCSAAILVTAERGSAAQCE